MISQGVIIASILWCLGIPLIVTVNKWWLYIIWIAIPVVFELFFGRG